MDEQLDLDQDWVDLERKIDCGAHLQGEEAPLEHATQEWIKNQVKARKRERKKRAWEAERPDSYASLDIQFRHPRVRHENRAVVREVISMRSGHGDYRPYHDRFLHT
ncbi:hypothetical protein AOQ84DRAFT_388516 [Glonium stellatum]|uniref:Uncharacterized protein n=1 Tax=Glonium stellatum TaxID=574774 RepID=A0A8E2F1U8_9PEZI|nr:hypothetical protein AOQ84DRAFT_388516 [Glonium stellatum]